MPSRYCFDRRAIRLKSARGSTSHRRAKAHPGGARCRRACLRGGFLKRGVPRRLSHGRVSRFGASARGGLPRPRRRIPCPGLRVRADGGCRRARVAAPLDGDAAALHSRRTRNRSLLPGRSAIEVRARSASPGDCSNLRVGCWYRPRASLAVKNEYFHSDGGGSGVGELHVDDLTVVFLQKPQHAVDSR